MHLRQVKVQPSSHCARRPSHNSVWKEIRYRKVLPQRREGMTVTVPEGRKAIVIPSGILECETHRIIDRCRLISMGCDLNTNGICHKGDITNRLNVRARLCTVKMGLFYIVRLKNSSLRRWCNADGSCTVARLFQGSMIRSLFVSSAFFVLAKKSIHSPNLRQFRFSIGKAKMAHRIHWATICGCPVSHTKGY